MLRGSMLSKHIPSEDHTCSAPTDKPNPSTWSDLSEKFIKELYMPRRGLLQ